MLCYLRYLTYHTFFNVQVGSGSGRILNFLASRIRLRNSGLQIRGSERNIYGSTTPGNNIYGFSALWAPKITMGAERNELLDQQNSSTVRYRTVPIRFLCLSLVLLHSDKQVWNLIRNYCCDKTGTGNAMRIYRI
jgi:hypothetical protein